LQEDCRICQDVTALEDRESDSPPEDQSLNDRSLRSAWPDHPKEHDATQYERAECEDAAAQEYGYETEDIEQLRGHG
jgi:hypothetical protein